MQSFCHFKNTDLPYPVTSTSHWNMFVDRSCALSKTAHIQRINHSLQQILGVYAKWRRATISFDMSICPSVRMEPGPRYKDFVEFYVCGLCDNRFWKFKYGYNLKKKRNRHFTWIYVHLWLQLELPWWLSIVVDAKLPYFYANNDIHN